jgi:hypothetical protein
MSKVPANLSASLGKKIGDLCPFSIAADNSQNHCAHYVSHMMGYELPGPTCKNATWTDKQKADKGATIRVNDLFNACQAKGLLSSKPATLTECLIFVTVNTNIAKAGQQLKMNTHPKKHVGILFQGKVWNYSNSQRKVVADAISAFQGKFSQVYKTAGATVEFYYGSFI